LSLALLSCTAESDDLNDATQISSALELPNGGLTGDAESPMFGDENFERGGLIEPDAPVDDPFATDPEVVGMTAAPGAGLYVATIAWGRFPAAHTQGQIRDWSGRFRVNRGALVVRRTFGFEGPDLLSQRESRDVVAFTSFTGPHREGLVLLAIDPDAATATEPFTISYETADSTVVFAMTDLLAGPNEGAMDDLGNKMVAVANVRRDDGCQHGFLEGRWHAVREGLGRLYARVYDDEKTPIGYLRGIWGVRENGDQLFFSKYIDEEGRFQGLFRGWYDGGLFRGRWVNFEHGEIGVVAGRYRDGRPVGQYPGGYFLGRWAETHCALPEDPGAPLNE
jgi:hypothetical protein